MPPERPGTICLLGYGEVGQALAADLAALPGVALRAWDLLFADAASAPARAAAGMDAVTACTGPPEAVRDAGLVISAVTAAEDLAAAESVLPALAPGTWYLDLNSVSPGTKRQVAARVDEGGGRYVEAAVMAPINPDRTAVPILLGGPHAGEFMAVAAELGFSGASVCSDRIGKASATKMCRSVIIKGMESLLTESMLAARHYGVEKDVLASLGNLLDTDDWEALARYMLSRSLEHGARRAEEMREAARTVREAGVEPSMSQASVVCQERSTAWARALGRKDLAGMLDAMRSELDPAVRRIT